MKKILLILLTVFILPQCWAKDLKESIPSYQVISDVADDKIDAGFYVVEGKVVLATTGKVIKNIKIEVQNQQVVVSKNGYFELKIPLKSYYVSFNHKSINETYYENNSPKEKRRIKVIVYGAKYTDRIEITTEKPVIYAYSNQEISFDLTLKAKGDLMFTYPELPKDLTWKMKTNSAGNLVDAKGNEFPYLFWDAKQEAPVLLKTNQGTLEASIVSKQNVLPFLDSVLTFLNLNTKEKTDFITYWGPRLVQKNYCLMQFFTNYACVQFAEYDINPKPDHFNRLYVVFTNFNQFPEYIQTQTQSLEPFLRDGFSLMEWGGIEIPAENLYSKNL